MDPYSALNLILSSKAPIPQSMIIRTVEEGADQNRARSLHYCVGSARGLEYIVLLVSLGAKVDMQDFNGNTPLHVAAMTSQVVLSVKY
jgi:ankyrin repeat protein